MSFDTHMKHFVAEQAITNSKSIRDALPFVHPVQFHYFNFPYKLFNTVVMKKKDDVKSMSIEEKLLEQYGGRGTNSLPQTLMFDHVSPATRLLEKRRQMFEVQEALNSQKVGGREYFSE